MTSAPKNYQSFPTETAKPAPFRGVFFEMFRWYSLAVLKLGGWRMQGDWPSEAKMVIVAAPHTSNWDGLNMLAAAGYYRQKLRWMGKKSLTKGPFGWFMKMMGCVPVDRHAKTDVVSQMVEAYAANDDLVLAVAPEGTRSHTKEWKTGFYHIAKAANVPIYTAVLDYGTKTITVAFRLMPGEDMDADMAAIRAQYASAKGKVEDKFVAPED